MQQPPPAARPLEGRVALVTGAGVRLGRAIALALAQAGCDIVLHCHKSKLEARAVQREIERLGCRAKVLAADLAQGQAALRLARDAERAFGRVDILVNSAAVFWPTPLENLTEDELDTFLAINLKSPYILTAEIGKQMKRRGQGCIVNMACIAGLRAWKTHIPYSISKAGLVSLTVGSAKLLAPEVRVNAIAPGAVLPPVAMSRAQLREIKERLPLKRIGTPDDIVSAVLYLCSAGYVTGQVLCVDGGRLIV